MSQEVCHVEAQEIQREAVKLTRSTDVTVAQNWARGRARRLWVGAAVALVCAASAGVASSEELDFRTYRAHETIRFERQCADETAHRVQAYAEFESEDGRARALVLAYARHDAVRRDEIFIGLRLVALRLNAGEESANRSWSVRMEASTATVGHVGLEHTHFDSNPARGEGARSAFRTDATGAIDWLDFPEPGDEDDRGGYPHNHSPEMEVTATQLGLSDDAREVALELVLTELPFGGPIRLPGPTLWIPDRIWHERPPKSKTLGLLAALNPFEEGGIPQWLARGVKYGGCIKERKAAKRRFEWRP